jgi:hypothetical protein
MPASRIVFALNDLIEEIGRLAGSSDAPPKGSLTLDPEAYSAVKAEVANHFNGPVTEAVPGRFTFKGLDVICEAP